MRIEELLKLSKKSKKSKSSDISDRYNLNFISKNMSKIKKHFNMNDFLNIIPDYMIDSQKEYAKSDFFKITVKSYYEYDIVIGQNTLKMLNGIVDVENIWSIIQNCPYSDLYDTETRLLHFSKYDSEYYDFLGSFFDFDELIFIHTFGTIDKEIIDKLPDLKKKDIYLDLKKNEDEYPLSEILPYIDKAANHNFTVEDLYFSYLLNRNRHEYIDTFSLNFHYDFTKKGMRLFELFVGNGSLFNVIEADQYHPVIHFKNVETKAALDFTHKLFDAKNLIKNQYPHITFMRQLIYRTYKNALPAKYLYDHVTTLRELSEVFQLHNSRFIKTFDVRVHADTHVNKNSIALKDFLDRYLKLDVNFIREYDEMYNEIQYAETFSGKAMFAKTYTRNDLDAELRKIDMIYREKIYSAIGIFPPNFVRILRIPRAYQLIDVMDNLTGDNLTNENSVEIKLRSTKLLLGSLWYYAKERSKNEHDLMIAKEQFFNGLADCYDNGNPICYTGKMAKLVTYNLVGNYRLANGLIVGKSDTKNELYQPKDIIMLFENARSKLKYKDSSLESFFEYLLDEICQPKNIENTYDILSVINFLFFFDPEIKREYRGIYDEDVNYIKYEIYDYNPSKSYVYKYFTKEYNTFFRQIELIMYGNFHNFMRRYALISNPETQHEKLFKLRNEIHEFKEILNDPDSNSNKKMATNLKLKNAMNKRNAIFKNDLIKNSIDASPIIRIEQNDPNIEIKKDLAKMPQMNVNIYISYANFVDRTDLYNTLAANRLDESILYKNGDEIVLESREEIIEEQQNLSRLLSENKDINLSLSRSYLESIDLT